MALLDFCLEKTAVQSLLFTAGDIPMDNSLLRQVSSLVRRLPATESQSALSFDIEIYFII